MGFNLIPPVFLSTKERPWLPTFQFYFSSTHGKQRGKVIYYIHSTYIYTYRYAYPSSSILSLYMGLFYSTSYFNLNPVLYCCTTRKMFGHFNLPAYDLTYTGVSTVLHNRLLSITLIYCKLFPNRIQLWICGFPDGIYTPHPFVPSKPCPHPINVGRVDRLMNGNKPLITTYILFVSSISYS